MTEQVKRKVIMAQELRLSWFLDAKGKGKNKQEKKTQKAQQERVDEFVSKLAKVIKLPIPSTVEVKEEQKREKEQQANEEKEKKEAAKEIKKQEREQRAKEKKEKKEAAKALQGLKRGKRKARETVEEDDEADAEAKAAGILEMLKNPDEYAAGRTVKKRKTNKKSQKRKAPEINSQKKKKVKIMDLRDTDNDMYNCPNCDLVTVSDSASWKGCLTCAVWMCNDCWTEDAKKDVCCSTCINTKDIFWFGNLPIDIGVILEGDKASDAQINAWQFLLRQQYSTIGGLQDTQNIILSKQVRAQVTAGPQIIHAGSDHWITAHYSGETVQALDSLRKRGVHAEVKRLGKWLWPGQTVTQCTVQQQTGSVDCGGFAMAFAECLARTGSPPSAQFDQTKMRMHVVQCFKTGKATEFPRL